MKTLVALIEPCYYGLSFLDAIAARGYEAVAVCSSADNPRANGYQDKIIDCVVADIRDAQSIRQALLASQHMGAIEALIPGNDFCLAITGSVADDFGYPTQPPQALRRARNKDLAREAYRAAGLRCPKFKLVRSLQEAVAAARDIGYPLIVKPADAIASQHVSFIAQEVEFEAAFAGLAQFKESFLGFRPRQEYLLEEYLPGPEFSVEVLMSEGQVLFAEVTEKHTGDPLHFVELGHVLPTSIHRDRCAEIVDTATRGILALGLSGGCYHVEVKLTPAGPVIIETNGRPGGDQIATVLLKEAFGVDVFDALLDFYLGRKMQVAKQFEKACAIGFFTAARPGTLHGVEHWEEVAGDPRVLSAEIYVKPGDAIGPPRDSVSRLGHVIATASESGLARRVVEDSLRQVVFQYR